VANLAAIRVSLRQRNLFHPTLDGRFGPSTAQETPLSALARRTPDGGFNDLGCPAMGKANTRFGRNIPQGEAHPEAPALLMTPSPRVVSERLLARREFAPATGLNLLAAAWIQFQTHDWFNHGENDEADPFEIPIDPGDNWHERPMRIRRSRTDSTRTAEENRKGLPPTFLTTESHWWDASVIYSSDAQKTTGLRNPDGGGYLQLGENGRLLPVRKGDSLPATGVNSNWWVGLEILHTLFALEHNAICDALRRAYPQLDPRRDHDYIMSTARLINAALLAKIHTVEWTPAMLGHPTMRRAMRANWWGLVGERLGNVFGRGGGETLSGIPGSATDHYGVPFTLTEEFVAVYRMHSLLPDQIAFWKLKDKRLVTRLPMTEVLAERSHPLMKGESERIFGEPLDIPDIFYSFGVNHPGALTLHNFPAFLRDHKLPDGGFIDLAAVDIMRDRERGVPRYNRMRRLLRLPPAASFEDITENRDWAREMREVYGDVERVDLQVGMLAERLIPGFGFSETAFRIFILMASRRLKSDRFLTRDFNARVYTPVGMTWIAENDMTSVLLRHYPELTPVLMRCDNAFKPWEPLPA
jgi:Animal haem peroxidase